MTTITPERLRAAAKHMADMGYEHAALSLKEAAEEIEREQADEKRLDELAQTYFRVAHPDAAEWANQPDGITNAFRAGIRAVLAKLDEERDSDDVESPREIGWYRSLSAPFATEHFGFPPIGTLKFTASDGGKWSWAEDRDCWELREYGVGAK